MAQLPAVGSEANGCRPSDIKWSWACRKIDPGSVRPDWRGEPHVPRVGDLVLTRVSGSGHHAAVITRENRRLQLYVGDALVGVFGHRYATAAFEGEVRGLEELSLLTAGGLVGTVLSSHEKAGSPTPLEFVGFVTDATGERVNLKDRLFRPVPAPAAHPPLVVVVGTSMNAGKTTVAAELVRGLKERGFEVAACKLTGSVSNRDGDSYRSAGPSTVVDFSDYGFPSTYLAAAEELRGLFGTMLADCSALAPDAVVMEIADGLTQRETSLVLRDEEFQKRTSGVILASSGALAGLYGVGELVGLGYRVLAVSGCVTSSPLETREFQSRCPDVPVVLSGSRDGKLAETVEVQLEELNAWSETGAYRGRPPPLRGQGGAY